MMKGPAFSIALLFLGSLSHADCAQVYQALSDPDGKKVQELFSEAAAGQGAALTSLVMELNAQIAAKKKTRPPFVFKDITQTVNEANASGDLCLRGRPIPYEAVATLIEDLTLLKERGPETVESLTTLIEVRKAAIKAYYSVLSSSANNTSERRTRLAIEAYFVEVLKEHLKRQAARS